MESITTQPTPEQHEKIQAQTSLYKTIRVLYRAIPFFILMKLFKNTSTMKLNLTPFFANTNDASASYNFRLLLKVLDSWRSSSKNLTFDLFRFEKFENRYAKWLSQCLKRYRSLESLSFNFSYSSSLSSKAINTLSFNFKKMKNLQKLHFNWSQCAHMDEESLAKLTLKGEKLPLEWRFWKNSDFQLENFWPFSRLFFQHSMGISNFVKTFVASLVNVKKLLV